ncbi:MAG: hypothetical protein WC178_05505 [Candidatus Paceibacterota bacterium]
MKINRDLAIQILKYRDQHKDFYFPFLVMNKEYSDEDEDFVEVEPSEWEMIGDDTTYQTFELWENLQDLREGTDELLARGFLETINGHSLEKNIYTLAKSYRKEWQEELWESDKIEEYGLNEFIGGKADAYEDCLYLIRKYHGVSDDKNSVFINYEK